jgi:hypothetical protein
LVVTKLAKDGCSAKEKTSRLLCGSAQESLEKGEFMTLDEQRQAAIQRHDFRTAEKLRLAQLLPADKRTSFVHMPEGDNITAFNGQEGWLGAPNRPTRDMHGSDIDGASIDDKGPGAGRTSYSGHGRKKHRPSE